MKTTVTLSESEVASAIRMFLDRKNLKMTGSPRLNYSPGYDQRESTSWTIVVDVEANSDSYGGQYGDH